MANKQITYTKEQAEIVELLKSYPDGLVLAEISAKLNRTVAAGTVGGLVKRGFIEAIGEREIETKANSKVNVFKFVTADVLKNADGKDYKYTDTAKEVLAAAAQVEGGLFTLKELGDLMGRKLCSGHINHLITKGNIEKTNEMRSNVGKGKREVNVYGYVKDIPSDSIL